jgi:zinc transporter 1/2/3
MPLLDFIWIKLLLALSVFITSFIAGWYPFKRQTKPTKGYDFPAGESLACGVFLGAGLLHLLGSADSQFEALHFHYPVAALIAGSLFLFFLWLEHLGREVYHHAQREPAYFAWLAVIMLSIHAFLEGAALGLSSEFSLVAILFLAIIGHKWAASFAIAIHLNRSELHKKMQYIAFTLFAFMTPIGILLGGSVDIAMPHNGYIEPIFTSMAAGTFLYLGTLHGLDKGVLVKQCCDLKNYSYVILGFLIMALLAIYV